MDHIVLGVLTVGITIAFWLASWTSVLAVGTHL
jgi:hypothetical protein